MGTYFPFDRLVQAIAVTRKGITAELTVKGIPVLIVVKDTAEIIQIICLGAEIIIQVIGSEHPLAFRNLRPFQHLIMYIVPIQIFNIGLHGADIPGKLLRIIGGHGRMIPFIHVPVLQYNITSKTH